MEKKYRRVLVWMRRALRVQDNHALYAAMQDAEEVIPLLCLSNDKRYETDSPRRRYVRSAIAALDSQLRSVGSQLYTVRGDVESELASAARELNADAVYAVSVYDAIALKRDEVVRKQLEKSDINFFAFKDRVMFEREEILNRAGLPFRVFTPYRRAWMERVDEVARVLPSIRKLNSPTLHKRFALSAMESFDEVDEASGEGAARKQLQAFIAKKASSYKLNRDLPAVDGTSKLSAALSLGVISIREAFWAAHDAKRLADKTVRENIETFIGELIWREFNYQILANFPYVLDRSFKEEFANLKWSKNERHFAAWCEGRTGYPIVDAGMRQLVHEGWMHNRVRMIVASFLTKDLHINWQWGENFFLEHLCDADIASNNGGWQWSAGTGTDAQPWFRIFNPVSQGERFDAGGEYVRKYVPELESVPTEYIHAPWLMNKQEQVACGVVVGKNYPQPIVDHAVEREKTIEMYKRNGTANRVLKSKKRQDTETPRIFF